MTNRIRELRKQRGYTMKELGQMIGLAESTVSQYETGKRQPDNETLLKLGEIFETTVGYILGAEESAPVSQEIDDSDLQAAFWGGEQDLPQEALDELWADVKEYAQYKADQWRKKQGK